MIKLRPYQNDIVAEFHRTVAAGHKRIIVVCPTGGGKTLIGAQIVTDLIPDVNKSVLVLAHRREIITQTAGKLLKAGISEFARARLSKFKTPRSRPCGCAPGTDR